MLVNIVFWRIGRRGGGEWNNSKKRRKTSEPTVPAWGRHRLRKYLLLTCNFQINIEILRETNEHHKYFAPCEQLILCGNPDTVATGHAYAYGINKRFLCCIGGFFSRVRPPPPRRVVPVINAQSVAITDRHTQPLAQLERPEPISHPLRHTRTRTDPVIRIYYTLAL